MCNVAECLCKSMLCLSSVCVCECGQCGVNDVLLGMKSVIVFFLKNVPSFDCTLDMYQILQNVILTGYKLCLDS